MATTRFLRRCLALVCFALIFLSASAQARAEGKAYKPSVGQPGKDVVWVPTSLALANKMLDIAKVTPKDYVIDLGSGDGRIVITAAKRGARALGIEYNPDLVALSRRNAAKEEVGDKAQFIKADIFATDFSEATVITMFLLPSLNLKLRPKILDLKPGTRVVSNSFDMDDWKPDETVAVSPKEGCDNDYCEAYLWIVPAKVEGTWKLPEGAELTLKQKFQMVSGTLKTGSRSRPVANARLKGDQISFTVGGARYSGRVTGDSMEGIMRNKSTTAEWNAARAGS